MTLIWAIKEEVNQMHIESKLALKPQLKCNWNA
jgi:hypothetical protein